MGPSDDSGPSTAGGRTAPHPVQNAGESGDGVRQPEPMRPRRVTPVATAGSTATAVSPHPAPGITARPLPARMARSGAASADTLAAPPLVPPPLAPPVRPAVTAGDVVALVLISLGAFVAPVVAPALGLVLLWRSAGWHRTDKGAVTALVALPIVGALGIIAVTWFLDVWRF